MANGTGESNYRYLAQNQGDGIGRVYEAFNEWRLTAATALILNLSGAQIATVTGWNTGLRQSSNAWYLLGTRRDHRRPGRGRGRAAALRYLLRDEFTTDLAAGAVNGTAAEPGPGTRTVVDLGNRLYIIGGKAIIMPYTGGITNYCVTRTCHLPLPEGCS